MEKPLSSWERGAPPTPNTKKAPDSSGAFSVSRGQKTLFGAEVDDVHASHFGGQRLHRGFLLDRSIGILVGGNRLQAAECTTGTSWDQAAHDDVFLEAFQRVVLAIDRCVGENAGGFLERRRRDERTGLQGGFGDPQKHRLCCGFAEA